MNFQPKQLAALVCLLTCSTLFVRAQPAITFDQRATGGGYNGQDQGQGWEFIPKTDVTVLRLGLYEGRGSSSFIEPHTVAIWNMYGQIVASTPASQTGLLSGSFIFWDIAPTLLQRDQTYVIGAFMPAPVTDYTLLFPIESQGTIGVHVDPRIDFTAYRAGLSPGGISFPTARYPDYFGAFGPNFVMAVPEPSGWALALMAVCAAGMTRYSRPVAKR